VFQLETNPAHKAAGMLRFEAAAPLHSKWTS
jgi:hypothetical protein